jgi:predicted nucleic acid-binding protein
MKFWDSSAIVPLCFRESASDAVRGVARSDEDVVVWWGSRVECISAMARRRREGVLSAEADHEARAILSALSGQWSEVQPSEIVRDRAERLLTVHALRAADGLQLAAALVWAEEAPKGLEVVCLDQNLRQAALREGFTVLP